MVAALVVSLVLAPAPRLTLESPALRVSDLLAKVEAQTREPHRAAPDLASHWMAVRMERVEPDDFRQQLAQVLLARWEYDDGVHRLVSDREARERNKNDRRERMALDIRRMLETRMAAAPPDRGLEPADARRIALSISGRDLYRRIRDNTYTFHQGTRKALDDASVRTPFGRAATRIVAAIPPAALLHEDEDRRVVFALAPSPMQRPLPKEVAPILDQLVKDQAVWVTASAGAEFRDELRGFTGLYPSRQALDGPPPQVLVTVVHASGAAGITVRFFDREGLSLAVINLSSWQSPQPVSKPPSEDPMLEVSEEAVAFGRWAEGGDPQAAREEWFAPESHEPHRYGLGALMVSYSRSADRPILALLGDESLYQPVAGSSAKIRRSRLERFLLPGTTGAPNPWVLYRSPLAVLERPPIARAAIGTFLRSVRAENQVTLHSLGELAEHVPATERQLPAFVRTFATALDIQPPQVDLLALRFVHGLTPGQRTSVEASRPIAVQDWTAAQRQLVAMRLSSGGAEHSLQPPSIPSKAPQPIRWFDTLAAEPTTTLAEGLPSETVVRIETTSAVQFVLRPELYVPDVVDLSGLAMEVVRSQTVGGPYADPAKIRFDIREARQITLDFEFGDRATMQWGMTEAKTLKRGAVLADLAKDQREALDAALQRWRTTLKQNPRFFDRSAGDAAGHGRATPPP